MNRHHALASAAAVTLALSVLSLPSTAKGGPGKGGPGGPSGSLISGTITAVDTTAGTITVTPTSGTASTIDYTTKTTVTDHTTIPASDLAVGDTLDVSGALASVDATSVTKVVAPSTTTTSGGSSSGGSSSGGSNGPSPMSGSLHFTGVVATLSPLTLTVDDSLTITLNTTDTTTLTQVAPGTTADFATGETVSVRATKSKAGVLTASHVDVTITS